MHYVMLEAVTAAMMNERRKFRSISQALNYSRLYAADQVEGERELDLRQIGRLRMRARRPIAEHDSLFDLLISSDETARKTR